MEDRLKLRFNPINPIYPDVWFHDWFIGGGTPSFYFLIVIQICNTRYGFGKALGSTSIICKYRGKFAKTQIFNAKNNY